METLENSDKVVVGTKQTLRHLENNNVERVYIAKDADLRITSKIRELAKQKKVEIVEVETMDELGKHCGIKVKAAVCAITLN